MSSRSAAWPPRSPRGQQRKVGARAEGELTSSPRHRHFLLRHPEFSALLCQIVPGEAREGAGAARRVLPMPSSVWPQPRPAAWWHQPLFMAEGAWRANGLLRVVIKSSTCSLDN